MEEVAQRCLDAGAEDVLCYAMDVTDYPAQDHLRKEIEQRDWKIDVLINNAGISQRAFVMDTSEEVERSIMEVNYFAQVRLSKTLFPLLSTDSRMGIVSSLSGLFGFPMRSTYAASKHALKGYFESWQVENPEKSITLIYPGRIRSRISFNALQGDGSEHNKMDKAQEQGLSAERCASLILRGLARKKKKVLIGKKELILYRFYKYLPFLYYKIASSINPNDT